MKFFRFGKGSPTLLHGLETVVPKIFFRLLRSAGGPGSGPQGGGFSVQDHLKEHGVSGVKVKMKKGNSGEASSFDSKTNTIVINASMKDKDVAAMNREGVTTAKTVNDVLLHEASHAIHQSQLGSKGFKQLEKKGMSSSQHDTAGKVSWYAAISPAEFVAETRVGMKNGKKYPKDVVKLYRTFNGPAL